MTTIATLDSTPVTLTPGERATVELDIRNDDAIVEEYRFEVLGLLAEHCTVEPKAISVYPGQSETVTLNFAPPQDFAIPAGPVAYGVRVLPSEHPEAAVLPEGEISIAAFTAVTAELLPRTSRGRGSGKHRVAVDNRGNIPISVQFSGTDRQGALDFRWNPETVEIAPGTVAFVDLAVKPVEGLIRGEAITHPFTVGVQPVGGEEIVLDGSHLQEPSMPGWLPKALLGVVGAAALLALVWFFLLKPTIESAAKDAIQASVQQANQKAEGAKDSAQLAKDAAQAASDSANKVNAQAGKPPVAISTSPFNQRLETQTKAGSQSEVELTVPDRSTIKLTDLSLSNPQGDFGRLAISLVNPDGSRQKLFDFGMENFRNADQHVGTPIEFSQGQKIVMSVTCNKVGNPPNAPSQPDGCDTGALFVGTQTTVKP